MILYYTAEHATDNDEKYHPLDTQQNQLSSSGKIIYNTYKVRKYREGAVLHGMKLFPLD